MDIKERLLGSLRNGGGTGNGGGRSSVAEMTAKERRTMAAWNRFQLQQWAKTDNQQARAVAHHRRHVVSAAVGAAAAAAAATSAAVPYNASHHWSLTAVPLPRVSYWAHQGFPPPTDTALWAQCLHQAQTGQQVLLQQVCTPCLPTSSTCHLTLYPHTPTWLGDV